MKRLENWFCDWVALVACVVSICTFTHWRPSWSNDIWGFFHGKRIARRRRIREAQEQPTPWSP